MYMSVVPYYSLIQPIHSLVWTIPNVTYVIPDLQPFNVPTTCMWRAPITPDTPRHTFNPSADHDSYNKPINLPSQIPETPTQCGGIAPTCTQFPQTHTHTSSGSQTQTNPSAQETTTKQRTQTIQIQKPILTPNPHTQLRLLPPIPNPPPSQETRLHPNQWLRRHTLPPRRKQTPNLGHRRRWRHGH